MVISMETNDLRKILKAIDDVHWIPAKGKNRIRLWSILDLIGLFQDKGLGVYLYLFLSIKDWETFNG